MTRRMRSTAEIREEITQAVAERPEEFQPQPAESSPARLSDCCRAPLDHGYVCSSCGRPANSIGRLYRRGASA